MALSTEKHITETRMARMARRIGLIPADSFLARGLLLRDLLIGGPQDQRDDHQNGEAADDASEARDAGHDAGGRPFALNQRDDEHEGGLGADIADAVRPDLDVHADPDGGADHR